MAIFGIYVRFLGWVTNQSLVCSPRKSNGLPFEKKRLIHHPKGGWWPETLFLLATKVLMLEQSRLPCICFLIEGIMQKHGTCLMKSSRYENSCGVFLTPWKNMKKIVGFQSPQNWPTVGSLIPGVYFSCHERVLWGV